MTDPTLIRVLVVDDHTLFRRGVIALLRADSRFEVVAEAGDAGEAYRRAAETQPDIILLDNHLPGVNGVDALPGLLEAAPRARALMLTVSEDESDLAAALRGGARGYLLKTVDSDVMATAIVRTMAGESTVSPEMTSKLVTAFQSLQGKDEKASSDEDPIRNLSPREEQILAQVAQGRTNKEIARAMNIAETTVKIHVQHILRKLKLSSRVQAATYAVARATQDSPVPYH
ncbi:Two component transcriptional regulator, LuxR family [Paraburkholderia piptadeniae]|uniref:Two component transcriptional regulator, LuxR family n=1 Tax=Paraburkholderia piptadeniae TaxID=1701573 RepID=A0A1N7SIP6_9BURK|nr:response regulator [Paraburkholderia piptadeniae]SIT47178.1 Two component transcriptional regulator, LuxR family [Paraburkholderia piptadeniae]